MRKPLRMLLCLLLVVLLTAQCFPVAILAVGDDAPPDAAESTPPPDQIAPVVDLAEVRPADSETTQPLQSGDTLFFQRGVYHFLLSDPEGSPLVSGVDFETCVFSADGGQVKSLVPDEDGAGVSAALCLPNGRHVLKLQIADRAGNETTAEFIVTVAGDDTALPTYTVSAAPDYAPLGGHVTLTIRTPNAADLAAVNVAVSVPEGCADAGFAAEGGAGFTLQDGSLRFDPDTHLLHFRVTAGRSLMGERDVALVTLPVTGDADAPSLTYAVEGWAETRRTDVADYLECFSAEPAVLSVEAPYVITSDPLTVGMTEKAYLHVQNRDGSPAGQIAVYYADGTLLGRTNWSGKLTVPGSALKTPGSSMLYAAGDLGVSELTPMTVYAAGETRTGALLLATATNEHTLTWLSPLSDRPALRCAETASALEQAEAITVSRKQVSFPTSGTMAQVNTCRLKGLTPGKTYVYQIAPDGESWQDAQSFTVPAAASSARFFVLGDLAGAEASSVAALTKAIAKQNLPFGVQTGNLVSDCGDLAAWASAFETLSALGDSALLLTPGDTEAKAPDAANAVYARPAGCFSAEYGGVYMASIPSGSERAMREAASWLTKDAAKTSCRWKILVIHEPPYAVASDDAALREILPAAAEQAGVQFVFSGGACYARTPALTEGKHADSYSEKDHTSLRGDGVVYCLSGAAGEKPDAAGVKAFDGTVITDTTAVYLTAEASSERMTVRAWDVKNGESREIDSYTVLASSCVTEGHTFSAQSRYDHSAATLVCDRCGEAVGAAKSGYTGYAVVPGGRAYLERGVAQTGWFTVSGALQHAGSDAAIHKTADFSTETCTEPGERMAWCSACKKAHTYGETVPARGHAYDDNHHCTSVNYRADHSSELCGWDALDVAKLRGDLEYLYGYYTGSAMEPEVTMLSPEGIPLPQSAYTVSYERNVDIGVAAARVKGTGDCYGETTLIFEIRPQNVSEITAAKVGETTVTLRWEAASGAQRYAVYQRSGDGWRRLGDTTKTTYTASDLLPGTEYAFRVRPFAIVAESLKRLDGSTDRTYWSPKHSEILTVKTTGNAAGFQDVPADAWYAPAVAWAVQNGVTNGTDETHFTPGGNCTRAQMVTFLWRAKGSPEPQTTKSPFKDVSDSKAYYYKAVLWAVEQGITNGTSETAFSPAAPVTRGMVVTFLHRAAGEPLPQSSRSPFVDVPAGQYYAAPVQWAVEQKITDGMDATHFSPETVCTRAQIVTFLFRAEG